MVSMAILQLERHQAQGAVTGVLLASRVSSILAWLLCNFLYHALQPACHELGHDAQWKAVHLLREGGLQKLLGLPHPQLIHVPAAVKTCMTLIRALPGC